MHLVRKNSSGSAADITFWELLDYASVCGELLVFVGFVGFCWFCWFLLVFVGFCLFLLVFVGF